MLGKIAIRAGLSNAIALIALAVLMMVVAG
jgi:hypothetical protein